MKHISEYCKQPTNLLVLPADDYPILKPFLTALGIRSRVCYMYTDEDGQRVVEIQGENVYKVGKILDWNEGRIQEALNDKRWEL